VNKSGVLGHRCEIDGNGRLEEGSSLLLAWKSGQKGVEGHAHAFVENGVSGQCPSKGMEEVAPPPGIETEANEVERMVALLIDGGTKMGEGLSLLRHRNQG
jgi:hypothetical protein